MEKRQFQIILLLFFALSFIEGMMSQNLDWQQKVKKPESDFHCPCIAMDLSSKVQEKVTRSIISLDLNQKRVFYSLENESKDFSISLSAGQYLVWAEAVLHSDIDLKFDIATDDQFSNISASIDNFGLREDERYIFDLSSSDIIYIRVTVTVGSGYFNIMVSNHINEGYTPLYINNKLLNQGLLKEYEIHYCNVPAGTYWISVTDFGMDVVLSVSFDPIVLDIYVTCDNYGPGRSEYLDISVNETRTIYIKVQSKTWLGSYDILVSDHLPSNPTVQHPDGGETLNGTINIQWATSTDSFGHSVTYAVSYSVDGGSTWTTLSTGLTTTSYTWDTTTVPEGSTYLIMVVATCSEGFTSEDTSDRTFTIRNTVHALSTPTLSYPNGGETLSGTVSIQWATSMDSFGHSVTYTVSYSADGGSTWTTLSSGFTSTSYTWDTTTAPDGSNYRIKVIANCSKGFIAEDTSDSAFTIEQGSQIIRILNLDEKVIQALLIVCSIFAAVSIYVIWTVAAKMRWPWVVGNLASYDIKKKKEGIFYWKQILSDVLGLYRPTKYYQADLIFTYYVDGVQYQANKKSESYETSRSLLGMALGDRKDRKEKAEEDIQRRYAQVKLYYNPKDPNDALMSREPIIVRNLIFISIVFFSLVILLILLTF